MTYRVVGAPWAVDAAGQPSGDVVALEHEHPGGRCLVESTTLGLTLEQLQAAIDAHEREKHGVVSHTVEATVVGRHLQVGDVVTAVLGMNTFRVTRTIANVIRTFEQCCCAWGSAVSGEWPEFECDSCPVHMQGLGASGRTCQRHRRVTKCQRAANYGYVPEPPNVGLEGELYAVVCADYPGVTKEQRDNAIFVRCDGVDCDCVCHEESTSTDDVTVCGKPLGTSLVTGLQRTCGRTDKHSICVSTEAMEAYPAKLLLARERSVTHEEQRQEACFHAALAGLDVTGDAHYVDFQPTRLENDGRTNTMGGVAHSAEVKVETEDTTTTVTTPNEASTEAHEPDAASTDDRPNSGEGRTGSE